MIKFRLQDENNDYKSYTLNLNVKNMKDFINEIMEDFDYEEFLENMECGDEKWCGVHDFAGGDTDENGIEYVGYSSYEIQDFDNAIEKWKEFFKSKKLILEEISLEEKDIINIRLNILSFCIQHGIEAAKIEFPNAEALVIINEYEGVEREELLNIKYKLSKNRITNGK